MSNQLHLDIETFSECDLKKAGLYRYAEHPSTELLVVCFAFGDDPVNTWVPRATLPPEIQQAMHDHHNEHGGEFILGTLVPFELAGYLPGGGVTRAHNAEFERTILNGVAGQKVKFPKTEISQWVCTAAKMAANGLPRALKYAAQELKAEHQKDDVGRMDMMQLSKPRKKKDEPRWTPEGSPERFISLYKYCVDDVEAERCIDNMVRDISPVEQRVWEMDQLINLRGVPVDIPSLKNVMLLVDAYKEELREKCRSICGFNPSQTAKVAEWIREQDFPLENLQSETIRDLLKTDDVPKKIRQVLRIRQLHEMKAVTKYNAMDRAVCADDRLHGMFLYYGAATGRWSSYIVQLQNLYRGDLKDPEVAIDAYNALDLDWIKILYSINPMRVFSSTVRGLLKTEPGMEFCCSDYVAIEGRVLAWLASQKDKLEVFRTHGKVYEYTGARVYNLPTDIEFLKSMKVEIKE